MSALTMALTGLGMLRFVYGLAKRYLLTKLCAWRSLIAEN